MTDLNERFRGLDELSAPEMWDEAKHRTPRAFPGPSKRLGSLLTVAVALAVAATGIAVVVRAFPPRMDRPEQSPPPNPVTETEARDERYPVRCLVETNAGAVHPGDVVSNRFLVANEGGQAYAMAEFGPSLQVVAASGDVIFEPITFRNTDEVSSPFTLQPGDTVRFDMEFRALWGGPLRVRPICRWGLPTEGQPGGVIRPPDLIINVIDTGSPLSEEAALDTALLETGGLFESCRPSADGSAVTGIIEPPAPAPAGEGYTIHGPRGPIREVPGYGAGEVELWPMEATCLARVDTYGGFALVDLWFASPPDLPIPDQPEWDEVRGVHLPDGRTGVQTGRWTFLVDQAGATPAIPFGNVVPPPRGELVSSSRLPSACERQGVEPVPCVAVGFQFEEGRWIADAGSYHPELEVGFTVAGVMFFGPYPGV